MINCLHFHKKGNSHGLKNSKSFTQPLPLLINIHLNFSPIFFTISLYCLNYCKILDFFNFYIFIMGKSFRKQFFSCCQHNLRNQEEEARQQRIDELDIENHRLQLLLNSSLSQVENLSNEINRLSSRLSHRRHQYQDLRIEYESLLFQYNGARADVEHLRSYHDVQTVQNIQNNLNQIRRNFQRLLIQLQQRSEEFNFP